MRQFFLNKKTVRTVHFKMAQVEPNFFGRNCKGNSHQPNVKWIDNINTN